MNLKELSKEISYALRHAPWEYELELDEEVPELFVSAVMSY